MKFQSGFTAKQDEIKELFTSSFTASEGADEGAVIEAFVHDLMATTPHEDLIVWSAYEDAILLGCIFFSRLVFEQDTRTVFILSPVAVRTDRQKSGVGQKLIAHGLGDLRQRGVNVVVTYGDPNYYIKTGFKQIAETYAKAPLALSYSEGWLGQSLSASGDQPLLGPSRCVAALQKPELW